MLPNPPANQNIAVIRGFTLLEILIAMAIFTLIGFASANILNTTIESSDLSTERFAQLEQLQRAMLTIERDVLQVMPRPVRVQGEENDIVIRGGQYEFESDADGVGFVRGGYQNPQLLLPRGTLQSVAYRLQEGELHRLYSNYVDNPVGFEPKQRTLLTDIDDFRVEYMTETDDASDQSNWQETYVGNTLPVAIAVIIDSQVFGLIRREFYVGGSQS